MVKYSFIYNSRIMFIIPAKKKYIIFSSYQPFNKIRANFLKNYNVTFFRNNPVES